jgi:hypothetical protein
MSDNPQKISLTSDELKALDLVISIAQSNGVSPEQTLAFIGSIASALTKAVSSVTKVVQVVAPVVTAIAPVVTALVGGAALTQAPPPGGQSTPLNPTLHELMEIRRRANQP